MEERVDLAQKYNKTKPLKLAGRQLVIIGFGSVGRPVVNRLLAWSTIRPEDIIIYDKQDLSKIIPEGIKFKQREIVRKNYRKSLKHLKKGDIIIDLSLYVDSIKIAKYCIERDIHFINTSIESWDLYKERKERTISSSFKDLDLFQKRYVEKINKEIPTIIFNHGANPGMVSHFVRLALDAILPGKQSHAEKAKQLKVRTIHISEIDTQIEHKREEKKWRNTWSINGFFEEGTAPPELGLGSHERDIKGVEIFKTHESKAWILPNIGWTTYVKSYVPYNEYVGYLIQHAEALSINKYLRIGKYSPSVYYVYRPCLGSIESIKKFGTKKDPEFKDQKILFHSNSSGEDKLGVLLLTPKMSWWCGSICSSEETKLIFDGYEYAGPTSSQVVAGVLGAIWLIIKNPTLGILEPDDIPAKYTEKICKFVKPLLGVFVNSQVDWNPEEIDFLGLMKNAKKISKKLH